ncbi:MAG: hypothetical protein EOP14_05670 [Pseudomonas sp.]|nr:MAG: hypothetical protein EOP14_05670 [Pseudomonas sp.]
MDTARTTEAMKPANADDVDRIDYLYHRGWEFIGMPERLPSGLFQAKVHYRSLLMGQNGLLASDRQACETERQALGVGWEDAMSWAREHRDDHHGCL